MGGSVHELQVPTSQQLLQFKRQRDGPSLDNLLLDLAGGGVRTPWNKALAGLIAERYIAEGHGSENKKTIQEAFLIYLQQLQNVYKAQNEVGPAVIARRDMLNDRASDGRKYCVSCYWSISGLQPYLLPLETQSSIRIPRPVHSDSRGQPAQRKLTPNPFKCNERR